MPRNLATALKALQNASKSHNKDKNITTLVNEVAALVKQVKPGDALEPRVARRLVTMFGEQMELLYSPMPHETTEFAIAYFSALASHLKSTDPSLLWQQVASKGILAGLLTYLEDGDATHFERPFLNHICQVLTVKSSTKLTIDLRQSIGGLLSEILPKHPEAKKWILDSKLLGISGLGKLIMNETNFRVLDNLFAIAARLTPKKDDPQARRAFLSDIFNSASAKARLGDTICKNITKLMDERKNGPWFSFSDRLFAELGVNNKRPQRFILNGLEVCGENLSADNAALRLFLDSEIVLNAFYDEDTVEEMITSPFDNLKLVLVKEQEDEASMIHFELYSPPTWQNPRDSLIKSNPGIKFQMSAEEAKCLRDVLKAKGQGEKWLESSNIHKQSFSQRDMRLEQITTVPMLLKSKTNAIETYLHSSIPSPESTHTVEQENSSPPPRPAKNNTVVEERPLIISRESSSTTLPPEPRHEALLEGRSANSKLTSVRRGVIIDSDDDEPIPTPKPKQNLKRRPSVLSDAEDISPPNAKRPRITVVEDAAFQEPKSLMQTTKIEQLHDVGGIVAVHQPPSGLRTSLKVPHKGMETKAKVNTDTKSLPGENDAPSLVRVQGRIKGMKAMDGKPVATSTPPRQNGRVASKATNNANGTSKGDIIQLSKTEPLRPATVNGHAILKQAATIPPIPSSPHDTSTSKRATKKPPKAIWEADDFSQQARILSAQPNTVELRLEKPSIAVNPPVIVLSSPTENKDEVVTFEEDNAWEYEVPGFEPLPGIEAIQEDLVNPQVDITAEQNGAYGEPSSPIRPEMVTRRKLRDATTLSNSNKSEPVVTAPISSNNIKLQNLESTFGLLQKSPAQPPANPLDKVRTLAAAKAGWKAEQAKSPAVKIAPSRAHGVQVTASVDQRKPRDDQAIRAAQRLKNIEVEVHQKKSRVLKRKSSSTIDSDGTESDIEEARVSKTKIDAIAEVMTKIQDKLIANMKTKVSGAKGEVRIARTNLLEGAVADLDMMQQELDGSFARFMQLEESYGQVSQGLLGRLEELQVTNENVAIMFGSIIQEHDRITTATKAPKTPFADPLPACLITR